MERADIVIIGAGLVGLLTAIRLKEKFPKREVWVLDQAPPLWSASWRNAGFACFGSAGELIDEAKRSSWEQAINLYQNRFEGLRDLRQEFGDANIGFDPTGGWELFSSDSESQEVLCELDKWNDALAFISGQAPFQLRASRALGMNVSSQAVFAPQEGAIQSHLLLRSVRNKALSLGVECYDGVAVNKLESTSADDWILHLNGGLTVQARKLVLCTNAYTRLLEGAFDARPARGQVLVTSAISDLPFRGIFHADQGYLYFRSLGTRILIGGGRNLDFATEETLSSEPNGAIRNYLTDYLKNVVVPGKVFQMEYAWSGIMSMGTSREPIVEERAKNLFLAVRMGGMGVALGAAVAKRISGLVG